MSSSLCTKLIIFLLVACNFSIRAQHPQSNGQLVGVTSANQVCLTPAEHSQIKEMLQTKLALLKTANRKARRAATHPRFVFPLRWAKSTTPYGFWSISNYVDLNPTIGPNDVNQYAASNLDYNCGNRTYDQKNGYQHQGTDISLWPFNWSVMANEGAKVVAVAAGTIINKEDGNDDQSCGSFASATGRWNAVYIQHDDGSVAWYGHLKKNSLTPKRAGQRVEEGESLGFVGSSGRSSGPHLHFELYNSDGKLIDPFQGPCNTTITDSWWKEQPPYKEKVLNRLSVHITQPVMGACPATANITNEVVVAKPGQRFYFYAFGREFEPGDSIQFYVFQPNGQLFTTYKDKGTSSYTTFYWYMYTSIPNQAQNGQWKIRVDFGGKSYEKIFLIANNLQDAVKITTSGSPAICQGNAVTLTANVDSDEFVWKRNGTVLDKVTSGQVKVSEPGVYTAEINDFLSNAVTISTASLPTASLTGSQNIDQGQPASLTLAFTGDGPWTFAYRDSTATGPGTSLTATATTNPYIVEVRPTKTTAYLLTSVSNGCGMGTRTGGPALVTVAPLLGVDDGGLADAVEVYPVPATTRITVHIKGLSATQPALLELTDLGGRSVVRQPVRQATSSLLLDQQPSGVYLLRIRVGERTATKRVLKL